MADEAAFELAGAGSDLLIRVRGTDLRACLAAAVEAFAASLAHVPATAPRQRTRVEITGSDPADLLVGLLDEAIGLLDSSGRLAVELVDAAITGDGLHGHLDTVDLDAVDVHGAPPKAATWHGVRLAPAADRWEGVVMLDL